MIFAKERVYDLNIGEKYVPEWGAWEVGREVISNAIDADRAHYNVEIVGPDHIRVKTQTMPTLAQIKFIGGGTKNATGETIGCFGEGIKLAAMVAKRLGGDMRVRFDRYEIRYELTHDEGLGGRSVFMHVTEKPDFFDGMAVDVLVNGIARSVSGKFLAKPDRGMIEKIDVDKLIIYNKGVFVAEKLTKSLYDWNLQTSINRDRNVIDYWAIGHQIVSIMDSAIDMKFARELLDASPDMFELECLRKHSLWASTNIPRMLLAAVKEKYGADVIMAANDLQANQLARRKGYKVIIIDETFRDLIKKIEPGERLLTADEIVSQQDKLDIDPTKNYDLGPVEAVMDVLDVAVEVFVYESATETLGMADFKDGRRRVYLSSCLFEHGQKTKLLGVFVHELAHVSAKASDGTMRFEDELTRLSGVLARKAIG